MKGRKVIFFKYATLHLAESLKYRRTYILYTGKFYFSKFWINKNDLRHSDIF